MARYLRLEDIKLKPKEPGKIQIKSLRYFCGKCARYHWVSSNIGNDHKDYKEIRK